MIPTTEPQGTNLPALMSTGGVSKYLGVSDQTLRNWRSKGIGPEYIKIGQHVRYSAAAVDIWVHSRTRATSDSTVGTVTA